MEFPTEATVAQALQDRTYTAFCAPSRQPISAEAENSKRLQKYELN
jgi:hypothetical protein